MGESKTSARLVKATQKRLAAVEMRRDGLTYQEIADNLGYANKACAYQAVKKVMDEIRAEARHLADELVEIEVFRLDYLLQMLLPKINKGDVKSIRAAVKISESRRRLLGLDYETRVGKEGRNGGPGGSVEIVVKKVN